MARYTAHPQASRLKIVLARATLVLLIALNIGAASWLIWQPQKPGAVMPATDPRWPGLVLLKERDLGAMAQAAELVAAPESAIRTCISVGPFAERANAQAAALNIASQVDSAEVRSETARTVRGYWVHIPAAATRADALATARQLNAAGVRDNYVITAGAQVNHVSLGLFKDQNNAKKRSDDVRALGFPVRVEERIDERDTFWLDLESKAGAAIPWQEHVGDASGLNATEQDCSNAAEVLS